IADRGVCSPMRNQPPLHEPALVAASVSDNHGNVRGSLGGDVKAGCGVWEIAVEVPANPYVAKFKRSGDAATHIELNLYILLLSYKDRTQHNPGGPCRNSSCVQVGPRRLSLRTCSPQANLLLPTLFRSAWTLSDTSDPSENALLSFSVRQTSAEW